MDNQHMTPKINKKMIIIGIGLIIITALFTFGIATAIYNTSSNTKTSESSNIQSNPEIDKPAVETEDSEVSQSDDDRDDDQNSETESDEDIVDEKPRFTISNYEIEPTNEFSNVNTDINYADIELSDKNNCYEVRISVDSNVSMSLNDYLVEKYQASLTEMDIQNMASSNTTNFKILGEDVVNIGPLDLGNRDNIFVKSGNDVISVVVMNFGVVAEGGGVARANSCESNFPNFDNSLQAQLDLIRKK